MEQTAEFITDGIGFQWVNDTHRYHDLPHPIVWPNKTVFTTSMTHQLHCLFAVVETYSGLKSNTALPEDHHWHMIHCFDYMRQAIMCSADMALEGLETTFPDHNGGSDGWDSKHGNFREMQCQERTSRWFSQQFVEITARSSITWKASEPMTTNKSIEIGWLVLQLNLAQ